MNFKDFFTEEQILHEISQSHVDKLPSNVKDLLTDKKLPFNSIFGDKLRIVEPLKGGAEYKVNISKNVGDGYDIDYDQWVGYKIADKDKKNPIRLGKILTKRKQEVEKWVKVAEDEASKNAYQKMVDDLDKLLKTTNLQKQVTEAEKTSLYVVLSRAPIDVVRMGDMNFKNYSCHSPKGEYFYCALADAMMNAGVAYLISEEDYQADGLDDDENLQAEEIFLDDERSVSGLEPLARIRIRLVLDEDGNELAVPTTKIYAKSGYEFNDDFKQHMIAWAQRQNVENFKWDSTLTLKGGSYEDYDYDISKQVQLIWGKDINYNVGDDDSDFRDELEEENGEGEEQFYDEVVDEVDREEGGQVFGELFGTRDWEEMSGIDITISHRGDISFKYVFPKQLIELIGIDVINSKLDGEQGVRIEGWRLSRVYGNIAISTSVEAPNMWEFGEYYGRDDGGYFDYRGYFKACRNLIEETLDDFARSGYSGEQKEICWNYRYNFNTKILDFFGIKDEFAMVDTDSIIEEFADENFGDEAPILSEHELYGIKDINVEGVHLSPVSNSSFNTAFDVVLPDTVRQKLRAQLDIIDNHLFENINKKYPDILIKTDFTLKTYLELPSSIPSKSVENMGTFLVPYDGSTTKIKVTLKSNIRYPRVTVALTYDTEADLEELIDSRMLVPAYRLLNDDLHGDGDVDASLLDIPALERKLQANVNYSKFVGLRQQGQMELDLSSINRNMSENKTAFDKVYGDILLELNFGRGGMSNMSGNTQQQSNPAAGNVANTPVQGGVDMKFAGKPKFASTTPGASTQAAAAAANTQQPGLGANAVTNPATDPQEIEEFTNLLSSRQHNPQQFNQATRKLSQDPVRFSRFVDFITQSIK